MGEVPRMPIRDNRAVCCVVTQDYLPKLITLYRSILEHQVIPLYLLAADIDPDEVDALTRKLHGFLPEAAAGKLHVIAPAEIYGVSVKQMRFYLDDYEYPTSCKGAVHAWMQRQTEVERWLYLDCDMLCVGSLDPIFDRLDRQSTLLTPHRHGPGVALADDLQVLSAGAFNAGVLGIRRSSVSPAFVDWYLNVLSFYCLNDPPRPANDRITQYTVVFCDQRWLDLVPAYFPDVVVAGERGFNTGHWNVGRDQLDMRQGALHIGDDRITLLHLSGFEPDDATRLSKYSQLDWSHNAVWAEVHRGYRNSLAPLQAHFNVPYRFNTYADGTAIPPMHRRFYLRHLLDGGQPLAAPFSSRATIEEALSRAETQREP